MLMECGGDGIETATLARAVCHYIYSARAHALLLTHAPAANDTLDVRCCASAKLCDVCVSVGVCARG